MIQVKVEAPAELPGLLRKLSTPQRALAGGRALKAFQPVLLRKVVETSQARAGSGPFSRGWRVALTSPGTGGVGGSLVITNLMRVALFIEEKTKRHIIKPKTAKILAWRRGGKAPFSAANVKKGTLKGAFIFAGKVKHPGTKGKYVFPAALNSSVAILWQRVSEEVTSFFKGGK